jgi:hypothetical protein
MPRGIVATFGHEVRLEYPGSADLEALGFDPDLIEPKPSKVPREPSSYVHRAF